MSTAAPSWDPPAPEAPARAPLENLCTAHGSPDEAHRVATCAIADRTASRGGRASAATSSEARPAAVVGEPVDVCMHALGRPRPGERSLPLGERGTPRRAGHGRQRRMMAFSCSQMLFSPAAADAVRAPCESHRRRYGFLRSTASHHHHHHRSQHRPPAQRFRGRRAEESALFPPPPRIPTRRSATLRTSAANHARRACSLPAAPAPGAANG